MSSLDHAAELRYFNGLERPPDMDARTSRMAPQRRQATRILILSSTEALPIAHATQHQLARESVEPTVWDQAPFSGWFLSDIITKATEYPFVVIILAPDDIIVSRKTQTHGPRDNLLLELGMVLAANGFDRTFVLCPKTPRLKIPSDLGGLILKRYDVRSDDNWNAAVAPACTEILGKIQTLVAQGIAFPAPLFYPAVLNLDNRMIKASRKRPDILIGVNHGGAIVGGMLYYLNRQLFHFMVCWIDVYSSLRPRSRRHADGRVELGRLVRQLTSEGRKAPLILLVDDTLRSGRAMMPALKIVKRVAPGAIIRIGVIVYRPDLAEAYDPVALSSYVCTPDPGRFPIHFYDKIFYE